VLLCSPVALVVAVGLLDGAAQAGSACSRFSWRCSRRAGCWTVTRSGGSSRSRRPRFNETTMPGSRYISSTGTPRPEPPPVGPVNTPRQDEIDALNRAWRASGDEPP